MRASIRIKIRRSRPGDRPVVVRLEGEVGGASEQGPRHRPEAGRGPARPGGGWGAGREDREEAVKAQKGGSEGRHAIVKGYIGCRGLFISSWRLMRSMRPYVRQ